MQEFISTLTFPYSKYEIIKLLFLKLIVHKCLGVLAWSCSTHISAIWGASATSYVNGLLLLLFVFSSQESVQ